jgi:predicted TIM-barrel fold metal-dependent hydrolase
MFLGEERQMLPPFMIDGVNSAEVFLSNMNYAQVGAAVVVQEFIDGIQNDYLMEVAQKYPDRFFVCGMCDYFHPGFYEQAVSLIAQGFKGIAIPGHRLLTNEGRVMLNSAEMMRMFRYMEQHHVILSVTLADGDLQVGEMEEVISECPQLRIAIGHFGMPTVEGWREQLLLARHEHVMLESGGITWLYNEEFYPYPSAIKVIREAIDTVGADKLMWGSDYPRTITAITYRMSYDFVLKTEVLSDEEKRLFLGENARRFYGFENLPELPYIKNMSE